VDLSNSQPFILSSILNCILVENHKSHNFIEILNKQLNRYSNTEYHLQYSTLIAFNSLIDSLNKVTLYTKKTEKNTKITSNTLYTSICVHLQINDINGLQQEIKEFFEMACSGNFYSRVADKFSLNGNDYLNGLYLIKKEYPNYKSIKAHKIDNDMRKRIVKASFMIWMNGKPQSNRKCFPKDVFYKTFFGISLILNRCKSIYRKTIWHSLVTTIESNLVFATVDEAYKSKQKILIGTIHDGFYFKKRYLEEFISILNKVAKEQLNSIPEKKIRFIE